jgi:hypothetical protein
MRLERLAAWLVLDDGFRPADAVRLAEELVADGIDVDGLVQLACQPADEKVLDGREVEALFRTALAGVGLLPPSREAAAWTSARWIGASMIKGVISPASGALRLGDLWSECGHAGELAEMLHLVDAWESSVGPDRAAVEAEMLVFAPQVISAADRFLTAEG